MFGRFCGIACAILLHVAFILFGGVLFLSAKEDHGTLQQVELISEEEAAAAKEEEAKEPPAEVSEELATETEQPPVAPEVQANLEPALEAASLSAIEAALSGQIGGGGDFAEALRFSSGGRIGGMGTSSGMDEQLDRAFSLAEIDQKPQAIFQATPLYPASLRGRKLEGVVSVIFVVNAAGKVANPRVEKSNHQAFERPALEAVRKWKFEPAVKGGERVACKMRVSIRFQPS